MVNDYYQNARGAAAVQAFAAATTWPAVTNVPAVTLSATQPSGDQAQTSMTDPTGQAYTYGQTIANALSGDAAGTTAMTASDLIPNELWLSEPLPPRTTAVTYGAPPRTVIPSGPTTGA